MKNINELYKIQAGLKSRIGYNGPDKFGKMMLAMIVEFAEAANDWRGFKYWSINQESKPTLLEEYVDGLHFILEAGLDLVELGLIQDLPDHVEAIHKVIDLEVADQFKQVIWMVLQIEIAIVNGSSVYETYKNLFGDYLRLGQMLGFTEDQIAAAYLKKVAINHERQNNGY